jgi:hypothetical protein
MMALALIVDCCIVLARNRVVLCNGVLPARMMLASQCIRAVRRKLLARLSLCMSAVNEIDTWHATTSIPAI